MNSATFRDLIWSLVVGITQTRLYSIDHATVIAAAARFLSLLGEFPAGQCTLLVIKDDLVFNNTLFREAGLHGDKLVRLLTAKGLSRIDFLEGVREEELRRLFVDVANARVPPEHYAHIRLGCAEVTLTAPRDAGDTGDTVAEQVAQAKTLFEQVSPFREFPLVELEDFVTTFLLTFRRGANLLRLLSPVKSYSEHTYTHAVNVAILAMALADRHGLRDESVQEIGIAALMHDVGKLLIPKEILHKEGKLSPEEFGKIMQHPLYGAAYLARVDGLTPLAVLVALEHHRKYDTSGYPVLMDNGRRQHAASQIVAIADVYDALRSHRPYRRSLAMTEILGIMQKDSGTGFNPDLLRSFSALMLKSAQEP